MASSAGTCACACASWRHTDVVGFDPRDRCRRICRRRPGAAPTVVVPPRRRQPPARIRRSSPRATPDFTEALCDALGGGWPRGAGGRTPRPPRPALDNPYGRSKRAAEEALLRLRARAPARRCTSFGCPTCSASGAGPTTTRPSPRSATTSRAACRSASTTRPRRCSWSTSTTWSTAFVRLLDGAGRRRRLRARPAPSTPRRSAKWRDCIAGLRATAARPLLTPARRHRLVRALYATYVSYLPPEPFAYALPQHARPARRVRRDAEDARLRAVLVLHGAPRHHARRALPPHQDREVPGHQGRGALRLPAYRDRRDRTKSRSRGGEAASSRPCLAGRTTSPTSATTN